MSDVWTPGGADCALRLKPIAGVLWHWTAGEGDPDAVVRVLKQRGLSVHYVIGYNGETRRCADPATTVCYHGGKTANARFIGVEIANKAIGPATPKHPRSATQAHAHGRAFGALDFTEAQYVSIVRLADELSDRFAIPRVTVPHEDLIDVGLFSGHMEHIHVSKKKIDCGGLVMRRLRAHGYG